MGEFQSVRKTSSSYATSLIVFRADLVPVYSFGENGIDADYLQLPLGKQSTTIYLDIFFQANNPEGSLLRKIQVKIMEEQTDHNDKSFHPTLLHFSVN